MRNLYTTAQLPHLRWWSGDASGGEVATWISVWDPGRTADGLFKSISHLGVSFMAVCLVVLPEFMFRVLELGVPVLQWRGGSDWHIPLIIIPAILSLLIQCLSNCGFVVIVFFLECFEPRL